jgi:hypothetical protein
MFTDNPNIIKLDEKIFLYRNFIAPEKVQQINTIMRAEEQTSMKHFFEETQFGLTPMIPELHEVWEQISELLYPEYVIHPLLAMLHFKEGREMLPHCDSPGEDMDEELTVPDVWGTCCLLSWGAITYFGDFTGGEVYYPNQNVEIAVQPGDLVIHGAHDDCMHGVRKVTSGNRYAFSTFSLRADKNPGSFYNYKTPEYYEHSKKLTSWLLPLKENENSLKMELPGAQY